MIRVQNRQTARTSLAFFLLLAGALALADEETLPGGPNFLEDVLSAAGSKPLRLLENGAQVELLAIGTHGEGDRQWWSPSGKRLRKLPFEAQDAANISPLPNRQLVFRTSRLSKDATITWSTEPASNSSSATLLVDGVKRPPGYYSHVFEAPRDGQNFMLKVGVAQGAWKTLVTNPDSNFMAMGIGDARVIFSGALMNQAGDTVVVVTHNLKKLQVRLMVIDQLGETRLATRPRGGGAGGFTQTAYTFPGISPADVRGMLLQTRSYEWVEFTGLPTTPKPATGKTGEAIKP